MDLNAGFFAGSLSRDEANQALVALEEGAFLVRYSPAQAGYVLSVRCSPNVRGGGRAGAGATGTPG